MVKAFGSNRGFSLLELLFTLIIIGILTGIALPTYNHVLLSVRRVDGKIGLLQLAAQLEKGSRSVSAFSPEGFYQLRIVEQKPDYYLLAAYPLKSQLNDKMCGVLALNSFGQSGILRSHSVVSQKACW